MGGKSAKAWGEAIVLADRQHGVISRAQLLTAGLTSRVIDRAIADHRLRLIFRGVYALGHMALRRQGWWMAALLAGGEGAALSHGTAASLWDLRHAPVLPISIVTLGAGGRKHKRLTAHRTKLHPTDTVVRDGLRVTVPARTIVDLAGELQPRALRETIERAQDLRRFDPGEIEAILGRGGRHKGSRPLSDLVSLLGPDEDRARSHLERLFISLVRRAHLPRPEVNLPIDGKQRDFVWPDRHLVVETDGYRYHSTKQQQRRDRRRDRRLTALGWRPVRFTYEEVALEPTQVAAELRQLL